MRPIVGIGENSIDFVYRVPQLPERGGTSKIEISAATMQTGGQAATTMCTCATLGDRAAYIGAFGNDAYGAMLQRALEQRGVDTAHAVVREAPTRYAVILVHDVTGERVVLWHRSAALALQPAQLPGAVIQAARLLHVDGSDETLSIAAARLARAAGVPVTCDIDRVTGNTAALVEAVSTPIFAEGVAEALTGAPHPAAALRRLRQRHPGWLCATRGARGAALLVEDVLFEGPGYRVDVVDTTGAGDVFRGAFIHALLRGDGPQDVLEFANAAAAVSCTRQGAMAAVPSLDDVAELRRRAG
jgi:sugar/nucleoside kinase (ribokinase family)